MQGLRKERLTIKSEPSRQLGGQMLSIGRAPPIATEQGFAAIPEGTRDNFRDSANCCEQILVL
jgi:hypothetical protein